ncbi:hypothetical protein [Aquimarina sp. 2201CG5-10]|uniref:hypothetical protein n=1 Tax=Aquimarina callyspongiae TaxID=3098150 RepID=UPI002AB56CB3|nr:hypothetical protein [Aquimarina sp. 2201CG5-10]MDY8138221.1 hypothetical protein [Aquimarina sp. 2201CG5-10]
MKKLLFLFATVLFCYSCNNDDDNNSALFEEFTIQEVNDSGISGSVIFSRSTTDTVLFINVTLDGTELGKSYTANIYHNSLSTGGDIAIPLRNFDGSTETIISGDFFDSLNPLMIMGSNLTYEELIQFNGHIKVLSNDEQPIVIAQGNIGSNAP